MKWRSCLKQGVLQFYLAFYVMCPLSTGALAQTTHPVEVAALKTIKSHLVDPLKKLRSWKHGDPCNSNWTGIVCYNSTLDDGHMHVMELNLLRLNLSGSLSSEVGSLSHLKILDFMWNNIAGSIPKEIGKIKTLELLLVNGNQLTGSLPEELGYLPNLNRIQTDENYISGELPKSFAYLKKVKHVHLNNNSISGEIPDELSRLSSLVHFLLDNNNLTGHLPAWFSQLPNLTILQLDNNHFDGTTIPASYSNMSKLLKLSLRNCGLQGTIPDLSNIPNLGYVDLSSNKLSGPIPPNKLSNDITTVILANNSLTGTVPASFAGLPNLQKLLIADNRLSGALPSSIWQNKASNASDKLLLDFQNNMLSNVSGGVNLPSNVTLLLRGNPLCSGSNYLQFCNVHTHSDIENPYHITTTCPSQACPPDYEYAPAYPVPCVCAIPLIIEYRLKSPGFTDFRPYLNEFVQYLSSGLKISPYQVNLASFMWQEGPRLKMDLKLFPLYSVINDSHQFNDSELHRLYYMFTGWKVPENEIFGPKELLGLTLLGPYITDFGASIGMSGLSKGAIAGIVLATVAFAATLSAAASLILYRIYLKKHQGSLKFRRSSRTSIKVDGVKGFTFSELEHATNNFSASAQVGQGGYGKVYKGTLADGTVVAIKRAQEGSLQGQKEFCTEIELLSRIHHRNLVSLVGYCDEQDEQMLVYEFMPNGTLRDHLSPKSEQPLSFESRLRLALGAAKGILYLHSDADPPIFHRDIKASNILLDSKFMAKVADFGLSRLAPVPDKEGLIPDHVSTVVKGTPGYLDPEYFATFKLTDKSDVYSFGVVLLELLTGMHPIVHGKNIVREVNLAYQSGKIFSVIDERMGPYIAECMERFMKLALRCCHNETNARPSMMEIVRELENINNVVSDTDAEITDSSRGRYNNSASFSSSTRNPYISSDVSGSDF